MGGEAVVLRGKTSEPAPGHQQELDPNGREDGQAEIVVYAAQLERLGDACDQSTADAEQRHGDGPVLWWSRKDRARGHLDRLDERPSGRFRTP